MHGINMVHYSDIFSQFLPGGTLPEGQILYYKAKTHFQRGIMFKQKGNRKSQILSPSVKLAEYLLLISTSPEGPQRTF